MRSLIPFAASIAVAAAVIGSSTSPVQAIEYPWCTQSFSSIGDGGRSCAFTSFQQCQATAQNNAMMCVRNDAYRAEPQPRYDRRGRPIR